MKCIECGHELKDGAVFCIRCGAMQVSMDSKANEAQPAPVRPSVANNQGANARHTAAGKSFKPAPKRSAASVAVPIAAVVAVLVAAGALAMFVLNPGSSGQESSSAATTTTTTSTTSDSTTSASSSTSSASASTSSASASATSSSKSSASATSTSTSNNNTSSNNSVPTIVENTNTNNNAAQQTAPQQQTTYYDDTYYLSDTSSRYYSRSEVENMSNYDLYFARNEIFARHGRMFQNSDLQEYFNSKSWYTPTYTPEQWANMPTPLSDVEQKNSTLMLEVEKSRNSPYV